MNKKLLFTGITGPVVAFGVDGIPKYDRKEAHIVKDHLDKGFQAGILMTGSQNVEIKYIVSK
jgi:hypothetical protein